MNISIYGSGKFGCKVQKKLSKFDDINIISFIETAPTKDVVNGIENISLNEFINNCDMVDAVIVAVLNKNAQKEIVENLKSVVNNKNVYIANSGIFNADIEITKDSFLHIDFDSGLEFMPHLEIPVVDHCNLNCRNCSIVCNNNIEKKFMSIELFEKDIKRMAELCQIGFFAILGGETLLHPELDVILDIARKYFRETEIRLVTNGLLITRIEKRILDSICRNDIIVNISGYKPTVLMKEEIISRLDEWSIPYNFYEMKEFSKWFTLNNNHDKNKAMDRCLSKNCRYLKNGKLSKCGAKISMERLAQQFGVCFEVVENEDWFDIHNQNIDIKKVLNKLDEPVNMCGYCTDKKIENFLWEGACSEPKLSDYVIEE